MNNINEDDVSCEKVLKNNSTIKYLNLGNNNIGDEGCKAFVKNTTILDLELDSNNIGDEGCKELAKNMTITRLYLSRNNVGDEGKKALDTKKIRQKYLSSLHALSWRTIKENKLDHELPKPLVEASEWEYMKSEFIYYV